MLRQLNRWLARYRRIWDERLDQLDDLIEELKTKEEENDHGRHKRKVSR